MDKELRWKLIVVVAVIAIGLFFAIPWDRPIFKGKMRYGLDLQGGTELLYRLKELPPEERDRFAGQDLAGQIIGIVRERTDAQGVKQPRIQKQGKDRILIQLPGADEKETENLRKLIETSGHLKFRLVAEKEFAAEYRDKNAPPGYEWMEYAHKTEGSDKELVMKDDGYNLGGEIIEKSTRSQDNNMGFPAVGFKILKGFQDQFYELTYNNSEARLGDGNGRKLAIIMDEKVVSAPVVRDGIRDNGIITGGGDKGFELKEQRRLITVLNSGRFPVDLEFEEINQVGPGLGSDSIRKGMRAIIVAGIAVLLFMTFYYLGCGLVANFALCLNMVLILGAMNLLGATMTLPGIAGILLTLGIAVDANILIFERIREEKAKGKTLHQALKNGYERATVTIVDANVTTLITAAILWLIGTGPVRGFAITLSIGILASMFTSIFVTRVIFEILLKGRAVTKFNMFQIVKNPRFNFIRWAGKAVLVSCLAIAAGILVFSYRGERNLGIDFREGTVVDFNLKKAIPISEIRSRITDFTRETPKGTYKPYKNAEIQELWEMGFGEEEEAHRFEVRTSWENKPDAVREDIQKIFAGDLIPGAFENPQDVARVSNEAVEFTFYFNLKSEDRIEKLERVLLEAFKEKFPEALAGADKESLPGTLKGVTGRDFIASKLRFDSRRFPFDGGLTELRDLLDGFLAAAKIKLTDQGFEPEDGDFPRITPEIRRFADLALHIHFINPVKPEEIREAYKGYKEVEIEPSSGDAAKAFRIKTKGIRSVGSITENPWERRLELWKDAVRGEIKEKKIASNLSEPISRSIGISPIVAGELVEKGILAILFSLVAIVIYVAVRFQVGGTAQQFQGSGLWNFVKELLYRARYGIAAIVALAHDVLFTMGALAVLAEIGWIEVKIDLQILAAFLTIIGYSLNDTIVVFDRIRENLNSGERMSFADLVNHSINQTLGRTLLTSGTTFVVVLSLFVLGGGIIHGFSFCLLVGVLVGTYSSVYIASPVLLLWERLVRPSAG